MTGGWLSSHPIFASTDPEIFFPVETSNREKWSGQVTIYPWSVPMAREAFWWPHRSSIIKNLPLTFAIHSSFPLASMCFMVPAGISLIFATSISFHLFLKVSRLESWRCSPFFLVSGWYGKGHFLAIDKPLPVELAEHFHLEDRSLVPGIEN
jgi:hypothetical protein